VLRWSKNKIENRVTELLEMVNLDPEIFKDRYPAGILITKNEFIASKVINIANAAMTIPSIALFGFMLPFLAPFNLGLGKVQESSSSRVTCFDGPY